MASNSNSKDNPEINGAWNLSHPNLAIKMLPSSLIALRQELTKPWNVEIFEAANKESTFEGSLGTIAEKLGIVVDGLYDVGPFCERMMDELVKRRKVLM